MDELDNEKTDCECVADKPSAECACMGKEQEAQSERDVMFMKKALDALKDCPEDEVPVAAIVVQGETVVGVGVNRRNTDSDPTAHAEVVAIRDAAKRLNRWNLAECELFVTLEPCVMCAGAIVYSRIKRVVYGAKDLRFGACGTAVNVANCDKLNHRAEIVGGVLEKECLTPIQAFFADKRDKAKRKTTAQY